MDKQKYIFQRNTTEAEYEKNPKLKKEDVQHLMSWLEKQQYLPKVTEYQMMQFYHCCDYSLQVTKVYVNEHFRFRHVFPELFAVAESPPPRYMDPFWHVVYFHESSELTQEGYRLFYGGIQDADPSKWNWNLSLNLFLHMILSSLLEKGTCSGCTIVLDMEGFRLGHLTLLTITFVRNMLIFVQDFIQIKIKSIHVIRTNSFLDKVLFLMKPFMKKELWDMLNFHSDLETFYKAVPKKIMTKELSGLNQYTRKELNEFTTKRIEAFNDDIAADLQLRINEEKRPNDERQPNQCITASFKKLDID